MKWIFDGFYNWQPGHGTLDLWQGMNLEKATLCGDGEWSYFLRENFCKGCVCWRETSTCRSVLVEDVTQQHTWRCCCPVLFFDFIGRKLPVLDVSEMEIAI
ncbi:MAG: hypothetical protein WCT05_11690 [Lentisphaeria bacterium]